MRHADKVAIGAVAVTAAAALLWPKPLANIKPPAPRTNYVRFIYPPGQSNGVWILQTSRDLAHWSNIATSGAVEWFSVYATNDRGFYRLKRL